MKLPSIVASLVVSSAAAAYDQEATAWVAKTNGGCDCLPENEDGSCNFDNFAVPPTGKVNFQWCFVKPGCANAKKDSTTGKEMEWDYCSSGADVVVASDLCKGCKASMVGNNQCDAACSDIACGKGEFDGGDCVTTTNGGCKCLSRAKDGLCDWDNFAVPPTGVVPFKWCFVEEGCKNAKSDSTTGTAKKFDYCGSTDTMMVNTPACAACPTTALNNGKCEPECSSPLCGHKNEKDGGDCKYDQTLSAIIDKKTNGGCDCLPEADDGWCNFDNFAQPPTGKVNYQWCFVKPGCANAKKDSTTGKEMEWDYCSTGADAVVASDLCEGCKTSMNGDGKCDKDCSNIACAKGEFDGGDCVTTTNGGCKCLSRAKDGLCDWDNFAVPPTGKVPFKWCFVEDGCANAKSDSTTGTARAFDYCGSSDTMMANPECSKCNLIELNNDKCAAECNNPKCGHNGEIDGGDCDGATETGSGCKAVAAAAVLVAAGAAVF